MKLPLRLVKPSKTAIVLIVAIGIGLLAAFGARHYFRARIAQIESEAGDRMVSVVVAKADLPKGSVLSSATVAVRPVPRDYVHGSAIRPEDFSQAEGQQLAYDLGAGETVLWSLLEGKKAPTFSARVAEGRRAVTVPVDEISSISGMLEPGDTIDLLVSFEQQGRRRALPLLQNVRVMATGQRSADDPKTGESRQYETVTLDTTPDEARAVILAREAGRITALLRNPQDAVAAAPSDELRDWLYGRVVRAPRVAAPGVQVLYGGGVVPSEVPRLTGASAGAAR